MKDIEVTYMEKLNIIAVIFCIVIVITLFIFSTSLCQAQVFSPYPYAVPFMPFFNPIGSFFYPPPLLPGLGTPIFTPLLTPYTAGLPTFGRAANATIILPTAAPAVTAYAPLGTLNLTPSTLIFLILYLTLAE